MRAFPVIVAFLALAAYGLASAGLSRAGVLLFPVPVALCWARGHGGRSMVLLGCAALVGLMAPGSWLAALAHMLVALSGVVLGEAFRRRWAFGRCVAVLTAAVFALAALDVALNWEETRHTATIFINARIADLEAQAEAAGGEANEAAVALLKWFDVHWPYLNLGGVFGGVWLSATVLVALLGGYLRRTGGPAPNGSFAEMRPPDWLVWAVIAAASLWFVDSKWPNDAVRMVSWNSAVALAFVYGLNGLSILVYTLFVFKVNPMLGFAAILLLFWLGVHPLLCVVGLFDTWWELRGRAAAVVAARAGGGEANDEDGQN